MSGNKILQETRQNVGDIVYEYDGLGNVSGFVYYEQRYIYIKNGTNDIIGIINIDGELVASYSYDGWGNCVVNNLTTSNIGDLNLFRYRSYYYDTETGYYYLNSRYYDSSVGRFINSDEISNLGVNNDVQSLNVYVYCANNPIYRYDIQGDFWGTCVITSTVFGAMVGFGSQVVANVLADDPWY